MRRAHSPRFKVDDNGHARLFASVLLVGVTVIVASAVYTSIHDFPQVTIESMPYTAFTAKPVDADLDGRSDTIHVTYLTGPERLSSSDVAVDAVRTQDGARIEATSNPLDKGYWAPGEATVYSQPGEGDYRMSVTTFKRLAYELTVQLQE